MTEQGDWDAFDGAGQTAAVERTLTADRTPAAGGAAGSVPMVLGLAREYPVAAAALWAACSSADQLSLWFAAVDGDLRQGGRYRIEDNAAGTITACDPPHSYTATWEYGGTESSVSVRIDERGPQRALLSLEHRGDAEREHWETYGPGAAGVGWDLALLGLAHHLATGSVTPLETTPWVATDDARRAISASSRYWADRAIDAGADPAAARAAEARTTAFYLDEAD